MRSFDLGLYANSPPQWVRRRFVRQQRSAKTRQTELRVNQKADFEITIAFDLPL